MLRWPVKGLTKAQLKKRSHPQAVAGGVSESFEHAFHDTELFTSAVTTDLMFFVNTKATFQLSNLTPAGMLPSDQYFEVYGFHVNFLFPGVATAIIDTQAMLMGDGTVGVGAPIFTFTHKDKTYGPWTLSLLHGTGGATGIANAAAADVVANNSVPDGGFFQDGAIILEPTSSFRGRIQWGAAITLTAHVDVQLVMSGVLHRDVL